MKKISATEFMATRKQAGKNSKLEPYRDDILLLKKEGYTQQQIMDFLKLNGVSIGMTTLNWFIRSRAGQTAPVSETRPLPVGVQTENRQAAAVVPKVQPEKQTEPEKAEHPIIGKFDLSRKIDTDELM